MKDELRRFGWLIGIIFVLGFLALSFYEGVITAGRIYGCNIGDWSLLEGFGLTFFFTGFLSWLAVRPAFKKAQQH